MVDQTVLFPDEVARLTPENRGVYAQAEDRYQKQEVEKATERVEAVEATIADGKEDVLEGRN